MCSIPAFDLHAPLVPLVPVTREIDRERYIGTVHGCIDWQRKGERGRDCLDLFLAGICSISSDRRKL